MSDVKRARKFAGANNAPEYMIVAPRADGTVRVTVAENQDQMHSARSEAACVLTARQMKRLARLVINGDI